MSWSYRGRLRQPAAQPGDQDAGVWLRALVVRRSAAPLPSAAFQYRLSSPPAAPERKTLVYRGRRLVPSARRIFGWLSAVRHWEVERQEVKIVLEHDVVGDVAASTRHYRLTADEPE